MKKSFFYAILLVVVIFISACKETSDSEVYDNEAGATDINEYVVEVNESTEETADESLYINGNQYLHMKDNEYSYEGNTYLYIEGVMYLHIEDNEYLYEGDTYLYIEGDMYLYWKDNPFSYLREEVPELEDWAKYIEAKSNGKARYIDDSDVRLHDVYQDGNQTGYLGKYYLIYVGEEWEDGHQVNWAWFYVSENCDDVLWIERMDFIPYTLSEWRDSDYYRDYTEWEKMLD